MTISQKLRIAQKSSSMLKISVKSIPIYYANLAISEEKLMFRHPKCPFWTPAAPKRNMKFYALLYFQHLAHLLCQDGHFWEGGTLGILPPLLGILPQRSWCEQLIGKVWDIVLPIFFITNRFELFCHYISWKLFWQTV